MKKVDVQHSIATIQNKMNGMSGMDPCRGYHLSDRFVYINGTGRCAQQCNADVVFNGDDKTLAAVWMAVWAVMCFVATGFTIVTFLIDGTNFRYPERPIVFLAFCCHLYRFDL